MESICKSGGQWVAKLNLDVAWVSKMFTGCGIAISK